MTNAFFLTGDFNDWSPASPAHRLIEPSQPYGRDGWGGEHPGRRLRLGSLHLTVDLPAGTTRFKLLEGPGWERQWSTQAFHDREVPFAAERLRRRVRPAAAGDSRLPEVSPRVDRALMGVCRAEARLLRRRDLPFGSSVFVAALRPPSDAT